MVTLSCHGAKLYGSRIHAEFQKWQPKEGPREIKGTDTHEFTLKNSVRCTVIKPVRIRES
jgi:hypothetical protein